MSQPQKMLDALLKGARVSRLNCHLHGIAPENSSVHSMASDLQNSKYIPIRTKREGSIAEYSMSPSAIRAFSHNRQAQKEATRQTVYANQAARISRMVVRWADRQQEGLKYLSTDYLRFCLELIKRVSTRLKALIRTTEHELQKRERGPKPPAASKTPSVIEALNDE